MRRSTAAIAAIVIVVTAGALVVGGAAPTDAAGPAGGGVTLSMESLAMEVGESGSATLNIAVVPELGAWTIDIEFDPLILESTGCTAFQGGVCNEHLSDSSARVTGASARGIAGDLDLGSFTFRCVAAGTSALEIDIFVLTDADLGGLNDLFPIVVDGEAVCSGTDLIGDASCDGVVNPLDAALILQLSAGLINTLPCPDAGDTSGDGTTNPLDAALILQFSAGLIGSLPP